MPLPEPPLTVAQIKNLEEGRPVAVVVGTLTSIYEYKTGVGKNQSTVQNATLKDEAGDEIRLNIWNQQDYSSQKGAKVRIVAAFDKGKCSTKTKLNTYHQPATMELELSKGSVLLFNSAAAPAPADTLSNLADRHFEKGQNSKSEPSYTGDSTSPAIGTRPVAGQTVGLALKTAVDLAVQAFNGLPNGTSYTLDDFIKSREFSQSVHRIASDLIRISQVLETGALALSPAQRQQSGVIAPPVTPPTPVQHRPEPGPSGSAFPENDQDSDVPF